MLVCPNLTGLSHLVAASYSEDKYGVVQTTLPSILSSMLSLQEVSTEGEIQNTSKSLQWFLFCFYSIGFQMRTFLFQAVDRHFKLPHASSKPGKTSCSLGDSSYKTLRFALRAALKTAIYRITTTFGDHLQ